MKEFWNERFASPEYVYGIAPNAFFKEQLDRLPPGKILMPADGEGRNGVYAATRGWEVVARDISEEGKKKAEKLAATNKVTLEYQIGDFEEMLLQPGYFDCVGLIFAHFQVGKRALFHKKIVEALKPGGFVILEGFHKTQLGNPSGGPKELGLLFSEEELKSDFSGLSELQIIRQELILHEGAFHEGVASVIRLTGRK